jgi:hypothetical protein
MEGRQKAGSTPPRARPSAEAIGFIAATGAVGWSTISEFVPLVPKVVAGVVLSAIAGAGAAEAWFAKRREQRERRRNSEN